MTELTVTGGIGTGLGALGTGIDDLIAIDTADGPVMVALSGRDGGLVTLTFGNTGTARVADTFELPPWQWTLSTGEIAVIDAGGTSFAAVGRDGDDRILGYTLDGAQVGRLQVLDAADIATTGDMLYATLNNGILVAAGTDGRLRSFRPDEVGGYGTGRIARDTDDTYHGTPTALATLRLNGRDFLLTGDSDQTGISAFQVADTGALTHVGAIGMSDGLGLFETIVGLAAVEIGGQGHAIVASRVDGSDSAALSVVAIAADGSLRATDHILDSRATRFGAMSELSVVQHDGWTYVAAAGGDDGLSLFTLTPNGRLIHLDTVQSTTTAMLDSVSAMAAAVTGDALQIVLARHTAPGFTQVEVDLTGQGAVRSGAGAFAGTARDDLLTGSAGADTIDGGAGDDILRDGAGRDVLRGGAGADRFLLTADGTHDVIADFDAARDRLDLTDVPMLRDLSQITHATRDWGAVLDYRGETLELRSATGTPLSLAQIAPTLDWSLDRVPFIPTTPSQAPGTEGRDTLEGTDGDDLLQGLGGDDLLIGGAGHDVVEDGAGDDTVRAGPGRDTVTAGAGRDLIYLGDDGDVFVGHAGAPRGVSDTVWGGAGDDTLTSLAGDDVLDGGAGADILIGGAGNDTIYGGRQFDTIAAGDGADRVWGGDGRDRVFLNRGNDIYFDNAQGGELGRDTVFGGFGDDTIQGGNGDDVFRGEGGNDVIFGRLGNDLIFGGSQFDTITAGDGADTVYGGLGRDLVFLNRGNDRFVDAAQGGELGRDTVWGGFGRDTIEGAGGDDLLLGQWGADLIRGGAGDDTIRGGEQFDTIFGGAGDDRVDGGLGRDLVFLGGGADRFVDNAQGGDLGRDTIWGGAGNDSILGGAGNDVFHGHADRDLIFGDAGADALFGGDQNDTIHGGIGADTVYGGNGRDRVFLGAGDDVYVDTDQGALRGSDTITGGVGADTFVFADRSGRDVITDFQRGLDRLDLGIGLTGGRDATGVAGHARVTEAGVLLEFGPDRSILLQGLTSTAGLADDILVG